MQTPSSKTFWQTWALSSALLSFFALQQVLQRLSVLEIELWRSRWVLLPALLLLNGFAGLLFFRRYDLSALAARLDSFQASLKPTLRRLSGALLLLVGFAAVFGVKFLLFGDLLPQVAPIFWFFWWATLLQSLGLKWLTGRSLPFSFALLLLLQGVLYQVLGHLALVSAYPFSIGYSEASRHYYASLFFAPLRYGIQLPLPYLHPSRYLLLSLPYLLPNVPLWAHRLWQSLLWLGLTGASALLFMRRLQVRSWLGWALSAWLFLFFFQGAVYYHLQVCLILVLFGVSAGRPLRSALFVILASLWAGISRVNWFPVPAMLAIAFYLLETPLRGRGWRYWLTPALYALFGLSAALLAQYLYIRISGIPDASAFGSSFTSDLLWARLLPNPTFPPGILPGIALVSLPALLALAQMLRPFPARLHPLRALGLLAMALVLFLGGLVVSVKIGGGADLHNMDAFLVLLALVTLSFFSARVADEQGTIPVWGCPSWGVLLALLIVPLWFALSQLQPFTRYNPARTAQDIRLLNETLPPALQAGGQVLFITERQLLTFGQLPGVPLVGEYEQVELMEMAMSRNRPQLERFYTDLSQQRFALIVAEKQKLTQRQGGSLAEEHNAWARFIGAPLLCHYKPVASLATTNIQVFMPRPAQPSCKDPFQE